jgi:hypothetical protein
MEVISPSIEDEALQFLITREQQQGINHHNRSYWRRRDSIAFGRGWLWRYAVTGTTIGLSTLPIYDEGGDDIENGIAYFDTADLELLPPNHGVHCLAQTTVIIETALSCALHAPLRMLATDCPEASAARPALLGLGATIPRDAPHCLLMLPDTIIAAAQELKKHMGLVVTTTKGKLGEARVSLAKAGMLFGIGHQATVSRLARGDLSCVGHNMVQLQRGESLETGICAA